MQRALSTLLFLIGCAAVAAVVAWLRMREPADATEAGRPPYVLPVTLATVERGSIAPTVLLTGNVRSAQTAELGFENAGRIRSIEVREADRVAAGDVLARLDDRDAAAALLRAEAQAALAERELDLLLAGSRGEEIRRLEAEVEAARTSALLAKKEMERGADLVRDAIISESQYDALATAWEGSESALVAKREELAESEAGTRAEDIAVSRAQLDVRRAEVALAQRELEKTVLEAPFAAQVSERLASVGDPVAPGFAVFRLVDLDAREVLVEVPGRYAERLGERPRVEITLDEVPDFVLEADLDAKVLVADRASGNFRGIVRLEPGEDPDLFLKPGRFVRLQLHLEPLTDVLTVPDDAVRVTPSGTLLVHAAEAEGPPGPHGPALAARWVPVRVLGSAEGRSAVELLEPGLAPGDAVVVTGVDLAFPDAPLMPRTSAPGPEGEAPPSEAAGSEPETPGGESTS